MSAKTDQSKQQQQPQQQQEIAATSWTRVDHESTKSKEGGEFVNHGLILWEQSRAQWHAASKVDDDENEEENDNENESNNNNNNNNNKKQKRGAVTAAIPLDVDEIIDIIFSSRWRTPQIPPDSEPPQRFPTNVPLTQMVDVLVDLWEAEGLDM